MPLKQLFTLLLLALSGGVYAQGFEFRQKTDVKVVIGTDTLLNAWAGGFNSPVFSKIKLDSDATEDLYVFDRQQNRSFTFLARQVNGAWKWLYAPQYEALFPPNLSAWALLRDVNADGHKELFTLSPEGLMVYRNTPANGRPSFEPARPVKYRLALGSASTQLNPGELALPSLTDMDGDGDLDILAFDKYSGYRQVYYYKNYSKELFNIPDSLHFVRDTTAAMGWNGIRRCIAPSCINFEFNVPASCKTAGTLHGDGATLLALDLDNDGDKDLLTGGDYCNNLVMLRNNIGPGIPGGSSMNQSSITGNFPTNTTPVNLLNFVAPYFEDVNFDGKPDLLAAPFLTGVADLPNYKQSAWLYPNAAASANAAPVFTFQQQDFLQEEMMDQNYGAIPLFLDLDADGDLDMLVSNHVDFRNGNYSSAVVYLYTNVGNATTPVFKLTDQDFLNFSQANNGVGYEGINLQLGDLDNDGRKDLILKFALFSTSGSASAYTAFLPNQATGSQLYSFNRANMVQLGLDTNNDDSPYFYDMDGDGDLDLLRGTNGGIAGRPNSGTLIFYRRNSAISPDLFAAWVVDNNNVGGIPTNPQLLPNYFFPNPLITDLDGDSIPELVTAGKDGNIRIARNFLANLNGPFTQETAFVLNPLTNIKTGTRLSNNLSNATLHATAADLDGDQKPELIVGTPGGGLVYYKNFSTVLGLKEDLAAAINLYVYPNPANDVLKVSAAEKVQLSVFDVAGKEVLERTADAQTSHELHTSSLKPGVYFLEIEAAGYRSAGRTFIIQR